MLWLCRAGKGAKYLKYIINNKKIFMPWDGFRKDLSILKDKDDFMELVRKEKVDASRTSIATWGSQLMNFCRGIKIGDYVLIPTEGSRSFILAKVIGEYQYDEDNELKLYHSRRIKVIYSEIPRESFPQNIQYSLGAYRTLFKPCDEDEILRIIERNMCNGH